ncbi:CDP-glycerol glycerophosphotransferase family protein [Pararhizobium capsulatum]|nr:CDP-glycerol glycerophosphotransferase family protein [Pararhizobium capsulatum]
MINGKYLAASLRIRAALLRTVQKIVVAFVKIDREKVVFDHFNGLDVGCNPGYIAKKLSEKYPGLKITWLLAEKYTGSHSSWLTYASTTPLAKAIAIASAKVVVFNTLNSMADWPKKKGQIWIQTGHGSFGIKKIGIDADVKRKELIKREVRKTNIFLSNSRFETGVFMSGFLFRRRQVIELGHARNDIFFNHAQQTAVREDICRRYKIQGKKIVLFAPTHSKGDVAFIKKINVGGLLTALQARFGGEWIFGLRLHPRTRNKMEKRKLSLSNLKGPQIVDLSSHSDMQELLVSSEAVITDYSSGIFDFLLTRRPCFFHLEKQTQIALRRSIYFDFNTTPIPVSSNFDELIQNIELFDMDRFTHGVAAFLEQAGSVENGDAAEKAADLIKKATQGVSVTELRSIYMGEEGPESQPDMPSSFAQEGNPRAPLQSSR